MTIITSLKLLLPLFGIYLLLSSRRAGSSLETQLSVVLTTIGASLAVLRREVLALIPDTGAVNLVLSIAITAFLLLGAYYYSRSRRERETATS